MPFNVPYSALGTQSQTDQHEHLSGKRRDCRPTPGLSPSRAPEITWRLKMGVGGIQTSVVVMFNRTKGITNQTIFFLNLESIPTLALVQIVQYILRRASSRTTHGRAGSRPATFLTMMMHIYVGRTMSTMTTVWWQPWFRQPISPLWMHSEGACAWFWFLRPRTIKNRLLSRLDA